MYIVYQRSPYLLGNGLPKDTTLRPQTLRTVRKHMFSVAMLYTGSHVRHKMFTKIEESTVTDNIM